jgi:hypothetical protein
MKLFKRNKFNKKIIFVIGSGRSGTHLLGRTLGSCTEIESFIEDKRFFNEISNIATGLNTEKLAFKKVLKKYKEIFSKTEKDYILEKTHPNIWFVEELIDEFENFKFILIKRNDFATVSSMLNHEVVLSWYNKIPQNEINPFLGITSKNVSTFKNLPIETKCALRVISHNNRLEYLKATYPGQVVIIDYDEFYNSQDVLLENLKTFLDIDFDIAVEPLNDEGKDKWKNSLSDEQIDNINKSFDL